MTSTYGQAPPRPMRAGGNDEVMSDAQRWPDSTDGKSTSGVLGSSSGDSGSKQGLAEELRRQMTPSEVTAMQSMAQKVNLCRQVGGVMGAFTAWAHLQRRAKSPGLVGRAAWIFGGGLVGGLLGLPVGIFLSRNDINNIEDPQHLTKVLQGVRDVQTGRQPMPVPPVRQPQQNRGSAGSGSSWGDESMSDSATSSGGNVDRFESMRSEIGQSRSLPYSNANNASSRQTGTQPQVPFQQSMSSQQQPESYGQQSSQEEQQSQQPSSRWAQLRGDNTQSGSTWERIRQDNARQAYEARRSQQQGQPPQQQDGAFSRPSSSFARTDNQSMADPTFGKGASANRASAQREYEASFERERRGIDG